MHSVFNADLLHPYLPGGTQYGSPDPIVLGENQGYETASIVAHKKIRGGTEYQVRWWGYDTKKDSCLGVEYLANVSDLLQGYLIRYGL